MVGFKYLEGLAQGASGQIELSLSTIERIKIPLPPLDIQQKIVDECEAVDEAASKAKQTAEKAAQEIDELVQGVSAPLKKLSEVVRLNPSRAEIKHVDENILVSFVTPIMDKEFNLSS